MFASVSPGKVLLHLYDANVDQRHHADALVDTTDVTFDRDPSAFAFGEKNVKLVEVRATKGERWRGEVCAAFRKPSGRS